MRRLALFLTAVLFALPAYSAPAKKKPATEAAGDAVVGPEKPPLARKRREPAPKSLIRLAPDFSFPAAGKRHTLRGLRGQPVVLVIAPSPRDKVFRKQVDRLHEVYTQFAARQVVFVAAFSENSEGIIKSDIPWALANNGPAVAAAYGVTGDDFNIAVIGKDGNVDYQTSKLLAGGRVADVIQNSFVIQNEARKPGAALQ